MSQWRIKLDKILAVSVTQNNSVKITCCIPSCQIMFDGNDIEGNILIFTRWQNKIIFVTWERQYVSNLCGYKHLIIVIIYFLLLFTVSLLNNTAQLDKSIDIIDHFAAFRSWIKLIINLESHVNNRTTINNSQ